MTPQDFITKWMHVTLSERSACQQHFLDLCELLQQPKPATADPQGAWYTFERGVQKTDGSGGWADVWVRDHFDWEYKGKKKDLKAAYDQAVTGSRRHEPKSHAASANARACWRRKAFAGAPTATR